MKKNPWVIALTLIGVVFILFIVAVGGALYTAFGEREPAVANNSVVVLDVKGVIIDSRQFIKQIKKYRDDREVKAIVIRLDSPGGVVGPSQEIYDEILRTRQQGVSVVASMGSLAASGAYYIAAACEKIITNPGTITGSIGVIMEFANLGGLYQWAKIDRYVVKSGHFKDLGSEFRTMRPDERELIQKMIDNVHTQFKKAVATGRKLKPEVVDRLADGRIFSGEQAVQVGLADSVGGLNEAVDVVAKLAGIKGKPEIYFPPPKQKRFWDMFMTHDEDEDFYGRQARKLLGLDLLGQPLYLMPGTTRWL